MEGKTGQDTELLQRMQRDINCLLDQDRTTRRNALVALAQKCASPDTGVGKFCRFAFFEESFVPTV